MFSPQPSVVRGDDSVMGAGGRRRVRQTSRPASRTQRNERSANASFARDTSVASQRSSVAPTAEDTSFSQKAISTNSSLQGAKDAEGGVVDWTKNEKYRVSRLHALPAILKSCTANDTPVTAITDPTNGYALLLSHTGAYVWQYTSAHSLPHTFSFPLPRDENAQANPNFPFPLGTLVSPSANSTEPGLVVIMPMTGRIAYWDSVGSAVAEGLFTKKRGVEGKVPLVSGEIVTAICSLEPAGFILSLSSGRLAHLALRDLAGRPGVTVTMMKSSGAGVMGGLLEAFRPGSYRRDVVAVRAGKVLRMGEREVIVATARGNFSRWHVNRSSSYANVADVDLGDSIVQVIQKSRKYELGARNKDQFVVIDAAVGDYYETTAEGDVNILALTAFMPTPTNPTVVYTLVTIKFKAGGRAEVGDIHVIKCYATPLEQGETRPRLHLPKPGKTAFVVFSRSVVIVSNRKGGDVDTDMEGEVEEKGLFEDVVDFRGDVNVSIVGSGLEDVAFDNAPRTDMGSFMSDSGVVTFGKKVRNPGCILVAKGAGIVRVEVFDLEEGLRGRITNEPLRVKSKIEQAVFYGIKEDNPLNFQGRKEVEYPLQDIEQAALTISSEILSSTSTYLPALLPSLEGHLILRASHLRALAEHLRSTFPALSKQVMWRLLSDAEKIEAARAIWNTRDARLRHYPEDIEGVLEAIINELLSAEDENYDIADIDPVRSWFQRHVGNIGALLPLAKKIFTEKASKGRRDHFEFARRDAEANEIVNSALMTAWKFRVSSARLYNLDDSIDDNGKLIFAEGLADPWTSGMPLLQALGNNYDISEAVIKNIWGPKLADDEMKQEVAEKIAGQLTTLAEICCRAFEERVAWCESQNDSEDRQQEGVAVRQRYFVCRGSWIKPLVDIGRAERAYSIAEKWMDCRTLVELCWEELFRNEVTMKEVAMEEGEAKRELQRQRTVTMNRLESYFETFGEKFAFEIYEYLIENSQLQTLMNGFERWRERYLTKFLRGNQKYAKLSWMHDVTRRDYDRAGMTLQHIAKEVEEDLWCKKVELSLSKLASLAARQSLGTTTLDTPMLDFDAELELIKIQESLYAAIKPITGAAIDNEAAVQLGLDEFARGLKKRPAMRELWKRAFRDLVQGKVLGAEGLVDLLTLMDPVAGAELVGGHAFFSALRGLSLVRLGRGRRELGEKDVWRRCYLRDDWNMIANTKNKSDDQVLEKAYDTALYHTIKIGFEKGLFSTDSSPFRPLSPDECFSTETIEELRHRFKEADEAELIAIANELKVENTRLMGYIQKADLRRWYEGIYTEARRVVIGDDDDMVD
ncbi:hypothetical protein RUND412_004061 [Rhizina undulata]